jgi:hypothetical protein
MSSLQQQHQQHQLAELQQMQMQRQAIANAHSQGNGGYSSVPGQPPSNPGVPPSAMPQYTPQQIAAAAATAGMGNSSSGNPNVQQGNQPVGSSNIRAYLDQTVVPILLDGTFLSNLDYCYYKRHFTHESIYSFLTLVFF